MTYGLLPEGSEREAADWRERICLCRARCGNVFGVSNWMSLTEKAKSHGARGAYFVKLAAEGTASTLEKLIGADNVKKLAEACGAKTGDLVVAVSAQEEIKGTEAAALVAGQLRLQLGRGTGA